MTTGAVFKALPCVVLPKLGLRGFIAITPPFFG